MPALVSIDCESGALKRWDCGSNRVKLTHTATPVQGAATLTTALIESFRRDPPAEFKIEPPPQPPLPPATVMKTPREALADLIASRKR